MKAIVSFVSLALFLFAQEPQSSEINVPESVAVSDGTGQGVAVVAEPVVAEPEVVEEQNRQNDEENKEYLIQNSPYLKKSSTITITATGVGVVPASNISPAQGIALANRAAIVDAYRQMGEKMHGVHLSAEDTIKDMIAVSTHIRAKVASIVKNAQVIDSTFHNGLYQVTMQIKLDGKVWHKYLENL